MLKYVSVFFISMGKFDKLKRLLQTIIIYTSIVCFVGGISYWLWKNPIYNPAGPQAQTVESKVEVRFKDSIVRGRKKGIPYWTVYANVVESERNSSKIIFKNKPKGSFYNLKDWSKDGFDKVEMTNNDLNSSSETNKETKLRTFYWEAKIAEYDTETEDLVLKDKVVMNTDENDILKTDELHWNNFLQKATTNKRTEIIASKGSPHIFSDKVQADMSSDMIDLSGNVDITTDLTEEQQL
jgi:lipopolysaccharide export system protein LptA